MSRRRLTNLFTLFPSGNKPPIESRSEGRHFTLTILCFFPLLFGSADDEIVCLYYLEVIEGGRRDGSLGMDHAKDRRIGGLFFEGIRLSLGGDVVVEVGPDSLLIVKLIDDLSGLLNGLDDEFDLVV